MANFEYTARTADGQQVNGVMQAENETAVVRTLDERRLYPVRVMPQAQARRAWGSTRIRLRDLAVLYGQLADLLRAGVPILRALQTLTRAGLRTGLVSVVQGVADEVAAGRTLADAMADHPRIFTPLHTAMVRAGEQAGFLEEVLANLSTFLERQDELRSKVRGALIYPVLLTGIGSVLLTVVLVTMVPRFRPFFVNIELPVPTQVLFAISAALEHHLWLVLGALMLSALGVRFLLGSPAGRHLWDRWRLRIPLAGRAIRMVAITRFCRILGTMMANGVPILTALSISKDAAGSQVLSQSIAAAAENVRAGQRLSDPLQQSRLFPPEIVEMIAVAEESNQLEKVLVQVADTVERRTNRQVDQAVRLIEPLVLVVMAGLIGLVAVGLLYPIFTMSQVIAR